MELIKRILAPQTSTFYVALLRILLGVLFLVTWAENLDKDLYTPDGLQGFLEYSLDAGSPPAWYESFIRDVIIPIRDVFAPFQLITELALGLFLLVGLLTRPVAIGGFFFVLNTYLISIGNPSEWEWSYFTIMGALAVVALSGAGQAIGVDQFLKDRYDNLIERVLNRGENKPDTTQTLDTAETA